LGFVLARAGRYDEGFAVLCRHNSEAQAHYDLARMLKYMNQPELARARALLALEKDPSLAVAKTFLAELDSPPAARPDGLQTSEYTQSARAAPQQTAPGNGAIIRPIPLPPLPVVSLPTHE
jgi:hypothetical protein